MSRRKNRNTNSRAQIAEPPAHHADAAVTMEPESYGGNFAGALVSPSRGLVQWGTLDTRYDISSCDQRELMRRSRALVANSGLARVLLTIAMMVGSQSPLMASGDTEWDTIADALLKFENGSALICDRSGQNNLETFQRLIEFLAMRDGDCFIVLTQTDSGRAAWRLFEGHVVNGQPPDSYSDKNWNQGIRVNSDGRPTHYYFEDQDNTGRGTVIPAASVIHYAYRDGVGVRGITALAPAILHIIDIIERRGYTKATIKLRAMLGLSIEQDVDGKPAGNMPIVGQLRTGPGTSPAANLGKIANAGDKGPKVEEITMAGNTTSVMTLAPGQKATILSDDSPNPNAAEFENELLRDVAIGLQMPPQVIFWLEKQTGPMVRFTVRMAERRLEQRRSYARNTFLNRWIAYQLAVGGKAGRLFPPGRAIPDRWFACGYQEPASMTIDVGRDGNLELKQLDAGVSSLDDVIGPAGGNWQDTQRQKKKEAEFIIDLAKELEASSGLPLAQCMAMLRTQGRSPDVIAGEDTPAVAGKS
jgi:capsid protein